MTDAAPEIGTRFGPYLLKRLLGSGGMGRVYEAEDTVMDRVVALKLISSTYAQDPEYRARLQREARIAGRLQDPHVVPIHGAGEINGQLYVDMRLINGTDLETILSRSGPMTPSRAVSVTRQVARALDAAHAAGVMHRDVKPANILITSDDFAYLVDFGIANASTEEKLTQMGDVLGTWAYMAPERFGEGAQVDPRADVYALTCVLFEMLTGAPPYSGERMSVVAGHLSFPIPQPSRAGSVPPALDGVVEKGMAKNPDERYRTAGELARAAEVAIAEEATSRFGPVVKGPLQEEPTDRIDDSPTQHHSPTQYHSSPRQHFTTPPSPGPYQTQPPQWQPHYPPAAPAKRRRVWIPVAVVVALVAMVAIGAGAWWLTKSSPTDDAGPDVTTPTIDVGTLDVGRYDTEPRDLSGAPTDMESRYLESFRLAEGMANPFDIDPVLDRVYGIAAADPAYAATAISGTSTPLTQPAMEKYGMISGYIVQGYSIPLEEFLKVKSGESLMILLTSYPNPDSASRAATAMEQTDFDINPENERIEIPGYPEALAHYRPGWASIAATVPHGNFVASIVTASSTLINIDDYVARVQKTLDIQLPLLDGLVPSVEVTLPMLERDPDNMLSRTFVIGDTPEISATYGTLGSQGSTFCASDMTKKEPLYQEAGVDRCSMTMDGSLLRTQDPEAASAMVPQLFESEKGEYVEQQIDSPVGLPDTICFEQTEDVWQQNADLRYYCYVPFGRYVAGVYSGEELDVKQRAAAAYSILANSA